MMKERYVRLQKAAAALGIQADMSKSSGVDLEALYAEGDQRLVNALFPAVRGVSETAQLLLGKDPEEVVSLIDQWLQGGDIWDWDAHPY